MSDDKPAPDTPQGGGHEPEIPPREGSPQDIPPWTPAAGNSTGNRQQASGRFQQYKQSVEENFRKQGGALGRQPGMQGAVNKDQVKGPVDRGARPVGQEPESKQEDTGTHSNINEINAEQANVNMADTINFFIGVSVEESAQFLQRVFQGSTSDSSRGFSSPGDLKTADPVTRKFEEAIGATSTGTAYVNPGASEGEASKSELPEQLDEWYFERLTEREQCFVQAAAVLHGAPVHDVSSAAYELYKPLEEEEKQRQNLLLQSESMSVEGIRLATTRPKRAAGSQLLARTYTVTHKIRGAERLLWRDADVSGLSDFGVKVLRFLASEAALGNELEQSFLEELKVWPRKFQGECAEKATWALGVIWWGQDMNQLWRLADTWARSENAQDWRRAAALLAGAYEVERNELGENADQPNRSQILRQVSSWVKEAHTSTKTSIGCAAAYAYGLIGKQAPKFSLDGLKGLLRFPQSKADNKEVNAPLDVFVSGVWSYVILALSGYVRDVLEHLAGSTEELSHQRQVPQETGERRQYSRQREVSLASIFDAFFFIASASFAATLENTPADYSPTEGLPEPPESPAIPDPKGRDVVLIGILAEEEVIWRGHIATLLCAMIVESHDKQAFDLMHQWAEIVLKQRGEEALLLREMYCQFMVDVGHDVKRWCDYITNSGYRPLPAFDAYRRRLKLWQSDSRLKQSPLGSFADEVLRGLDD